MFELLLIACFTAFFLAVLDAALDFLAIFIGALAVNFIFSLALSSLGNYLISTELGKEFIIKAVAGAFLGKVFLKATERLTTYRPVVINQTRQ
jgi:hypothetical protein